MATGGCHCGAIRYEITGEPLNNTLCHCRDCRRSAGAPTVAWLMLPGDRFRVAQGTPRVHASSEHARRHFCGDCGTGLFYTNDAILPGLVDVQSATLDDPEAYPATDHIQVAERLSWMTTAHALPTHERYPPMD
jgi:hypothetical protein